MVLIILRNGQTNWNKNKILTGLEDIDLNENGIKETKEISKLLKKYNIDYIFCSNLQCSIITTNIIKNELNTNCIVKHSAKLNVKNHGFLTGKPIKELENIYTPETVKKWCKSYYGIPPNGESLYDVKKRCGSYFDETIKPLLKENKNILIISHSSTLKSLFVHLGLKEENIIGDFEIENCKPINIDLVNKKYSFII